MLPRIRRFAFVCLFALAPASALDLTRAVVVSEDPVAATVLIEEIERRSGVRLPLAAAAGKETAAVVIRAGAGEAALPREGFRLQIAGDQVRVSGADSRGALYGVGELLRRLEWGPKRIGVPGPADIATAPRSAIRGHQLGYRATANSWDAWTVPQFERYIRELALFGVNSIENIPFGNESKNPLVKAGKREMNRAMGEICRKYGLDYWYWTPVTVDLKDAAAAARAIEEFERAFADAPELAGVFIPGGDPGNNPPELLLPYLEKIAAALAGRHPRAKLWLSLQGFTEAQANLAYRWLWRGAPAWFAGIVHGPSSPSIEDTRRNLPPGVKLRLYPDITHNKLSQYEVPDWDQAYELILGREAINPRPVEYAAIHNRYAALSDGFLSYSDGVHDDVNKVIWSALAWDPRRDVRDILIDYARLHFTGDTASAAAIADGILALERNWRGPLATNGGVEAAWHYWTALEAQFPQLAADNWRWQMCLLRAHYDAYLRRRLLQDAALEQEANDRLRRAVEIGSEAAMKGAEDILQRAVAEPAGAQLRARIVDLCERLWQSIGLQTSVPKYHASGAERGAVLDFIDRPLNNRWWLEDEFAKVRKMTGEAERVARLRQLAEWENPGEGSFYDDLGNIARMPHVIRGEGENYTPLYWWWDQGQSRARLSWQVTMWPKAMFYDGLDPRAKYVVRTSGYGQALLKMDGARVAPALDGREMGEFKEFPVPEWCLTDGRLELTWDRAGDEEHLNWRRQSRLAEVWLLRVR